MPEIKISNGDLVIVDDDDFEWISKLKWSSNGNGYSYRKIGVKTTYMHREIMQAKKGQEIDHINRDKLDNRKSNLRFCSRSENQRNLFRKNKSGFKGVHRSDCKVERYNSTIHVNGKRFYLGTFETAEEAAKAYNEAAKQHHKEFAYESTI